MHRLSPAPPQPRSWVDVAGSKLGLRSMVGMGAELLGIGWTYFWCAADTGADNGHSRADLVTYEYSATCGLLGNVRSDKLV